MSRAPRLELPDGFSHVTCRGNRREPIYLGDADRIRYLALTAEALARFEVTLHAYCLMTNHVHLLFEAKRHDLSAAMHRLNWAYARWFNLRYGHVGHLFQERFHAVAITHDSQLTNTARYIHRNPIRASICRRAAEWPWSSYRATVGDEPCPPFLELSTILEQFSLRRSVARSAFRAFVNEERADEQAGFLTRASVSRVPVTVTGTRLDQPTPYAPGNRAARSLISSAAGRPTTFR